MRWPAIAARLTLCFVAILCVTGTARAQGGPPFLTDDPETPGNKHWEINYGFVGDRNPGAGAYQVPDIDINYGLGERIQLKYELPIAIAESRPQPATASQPQLYGHVVGGIGESSLGMKLRFYQHSPGDPWFRPGHRPQPASKSAGGSTDGPEAKQGVAADVLEEPVVNFSLGTYPQFTFDNPTRSVPRGVVPPGPNLLLPLEFNARLGPIRINGDAGYQFGNHALAQSWERGLLVGHEFSDRTEVYAELYDLQDANRINGMPKQRQTTLDIGGRQAMNHSKTLILLLMGGRSFQAVTAANSQPRWIAYVGVQTLFGPK